MNKGKYRCLKLEGHPMKQRREGKDEREMGLLDFYSVAVISASWGCQTDY